MRGCLVVAAAAAWVGAVVVVVVAGFQVGEAGAAWNTGRPGDKEVGRGPLTNRTRVSGGHSMKAYGKDGLLEAGYRAEAQATNGGRREEKRGVDWRLIDQLRRLLGKYNEWILGSSGGEYGQN